MDSKSQVIEQTEIATSKMVAAQDPQQQQSQDHLHYFLPKKLHTCALCALFALPLLCYFLSHSPPPFISSKLLTPPSQSHHTNVPSPSPLPPPQGAAQCDYGDGRWVWDERDSPRYDSTSCDMKSTEKCVANGKPGKGYLHWRWQPAQCNLSALEPAAFLRSIRGKHLAFVGDSTARNQAESLVCFLSTVSHPETLHRYEERLGLKFWRWAFPAPHNATVSTYWAPFLVKAEGKSEDYSMEHNTVFLDAFTEQWTAETDGMDIMVISTGHWFVQPAIYYDGGKVIGMHSRPDVIHTEIGFFVVYREVIRRSLDYINMRAMSNDKLVVVATIAPSHFEGKYKWNHPDACSRTAPYKEGEKEVGYIEAELRKTIVEEVAAAEAAAERKKAVRFEVLDVTRLATMRPDGHPGAYIIRDPFHGGHVPATVLNDCLHWCAPGPVDTFNDILMQILASSAEIE